MSLEFKVCLLILFPSLTLTQADHLCVSLISQWIRFNWSKLLTTQENWAFVLLDSLHFGTSLLNLLSLQVANTSPQSLLPHLKGALCICSKLDVPATLKIKNPGPSSPPLCRSPEILVKQLLQWELLAEPMG